MKQLITAAAIDCPGRLGDDSYRALEIQVEGVETPFHCVLALPIVACKALEGTVDAVGNCNDNRRNVKKY